MKRSLLLITCLIGLFSCKKNSDNTRKNNNNVNPASKTFKASVVDRESDVVVLTWNRPPNADSSDQVLYHIVLGGDTTQYDPYNGPDFVLHPIDTIAQHGKVIASTTAKGVIAIDTFYVAAYSANYYAYQTTDSHLLRMNIDYSGTQQWSIYNPLQSKALPAVNGYIAYIGTEDGYVDAINTKTGGIIWSINTGDYIDGSILYNLGTIYVVGNSANVTADLIAINTKTHAIKWKITNPALATGQPIITNNTIYIATGSQLLAINAQTGSQNWEFDEDGIYAAICTDGINIYFYSPNGMGSVKAQTGSLNWQTPASLNHPARAITNVHNGVVFQYIDSLTQAVDASNGNMLWKTPPSTLPAFKGDTVFIGYGSQVHALNLKTGAQIWQSKLTDYDLTGEIMVIGNLVFAGRGGLGYDNDYAGGGRNSYRLSTATGLALYLNGTPAFDYHELEILPVITINGKTYYDGSSIMSRSF